MFFYIRLYYFGVLKIEEYDRNFLFLLNVKFSGGCQIMRWVEMVFKNSEGLVQSEEDVYTVFLFIERLSSLQGFREEVLFVLEYGSLDGEKRFFVWWCSLVWDIGV